jgi:hypothetical protein
MIFNFLKRKCRRVPFQRYEDFFIKMNKKYNGSLCIHYGFGWGKRDPLETYVTYEMETPKHQVKFRARSGSLDSTLKQIYKLVYRFDRYSKIGDIEDWQSRYENLKAQKNIEIERKGSPPAHL